MKENLKCLGCNGTGITNFFNHSLDHAIKITCKCCDGFGTVPNYKYIGQQLKKENVRCNKLIDKLQKSAFSFRYHSDNVTKARALLNIELKNENEKLKKEKLHCYEIIENIRKEKLDLYTKAEKFKKEDNHKIQDLQKENEKLNEQNKFLKQDIKSLQFANANDQNSKSLKNKIKYLDIGLNALNNSVKNLSDENKKLKNENEEYKISKLESYNQHDVDVTIIFDKNQKIECLKKENKTYRDRLQIDPGGSDEIDALESSTQLLKHRIKCLENELEELKKQPRNIYLINEISRLTKRIGDLNNEKTIITEYTFILKDAYQDTLKEYNELKTKIDNSKKHY